MRLHNCAGSTEPSLLVHDMYQINSAGSTEPSLLVHDMYQILMNWLNYGSS